MLQVTIQGANTISGIFQLGTLMDNFINQPGVIMLNQENTYWRIHTPKTALTELIIALYSLEQLPMYVEIVAI